MDLRRIPFFDYRPMYEQHREEIKAAIDRVLNSGQLILGPEVQAFEEEFAAYVGVSGAVGVNSGTDALTLALRALEIGTGDDVITVANVGVPTVAAIRAAGATPRFVDIRSDTLLMDPSALEDVAGERTRCILPVHLYGQPVDMDSVLTFASKRCLPVVEDCAQAHGARVHGKHVGSLGTIGCFSFYPTKNLGAFGDGGMCVTDDPALAKRIRSQRMYGFAADGHAHVEGLNTRLDEIQASILRVHLRHLDATIEKRQALAQRYLSGLNRLLYRHPDGSPNAVHAYHLFVVEASDRPRVCSALESEDIGYGIHYPEAVHEMEAYRFLGYQRGDLPASELSAARVVSLPLHPGLHMDAVDRVVEVLNRLAR